MKLHRSPILPTIVGVFITMIVAPAWCAPGDDLVGRWRATLASPGGPLPFGLEISRDEDVLTATVINGPERVPLSEVMVDGDAAVFTIDWYDASITARVDNETLRGEWRRANAGGSYSTLPFSAARGEHPRFEPTMRVIDDPTTVDIDGEWTVTFHDDDGETPAIAVFETVDGHQVHGTFLTSTGDYRFLAGRYEHGYLRLSCFDGAHAFLFHATAQPDGSLRGDFWSRDTYHATWTAKPRRNTDVLDDPWKITRLRNPGEHLAFSFADVEGQQVALTDERFQGKVVIVDVFGTWCPNCHDQAPVLAAWDARWREAGLEIVGLAFEHTADEERSRRQIRAFAERHDIEFPILIAGISHKQTAAKSLPQLTSVHAYPTTIFIGRDGMVRRIHTGFAGPGTGEYHERLIAESEALIERLLAED